MSNKSKKNKNQSSKPKTITVPKDDPMNDIIEDALGDNTEQTNEKLVIPVKAAVDMSVKELRALIKEKQGDRVKSDVVSRGKNKLAKLRTYAIRQRSWADSQITKATASEKKALAAETKLIEYEKKLGVEPLNQEEIDAALVELQKAGRIAQTSIAPILAPNEADEATEATKVE